MPDLQRPESSPGCHTHLLRVTPLLWCLLLAQESLGILLTSHHSSSRTAGVFYVVLGIQTRILTLVWQVLCALSNLPAHDVL